MTAFSVILWTLTAGLHAAVEPGRAPAQSPNMETCQALAAMPNLTITLARLEPAAGFVPEHCYIQGTISGSIRFHMQLPLPADWNGRLLNIGDGGKDGDLDFADARLEQGYAVANSNTGHDVGAEPGAWFGFDNPQALVDFGYRAVHLTANASKTVVGAYYGRAPRYAYFEGCSTGGRQGLMEAQRFPSDFDGIVSEAPVLDYQAINAGHIWMTQRLYAADFAGNLAFDADGDGSQESLTKWEVLRDTVSAVCDPVDGIEDGLIEDPRMCPFDPERHLADRMCEPGVDGDACFTDRQIQAVRDLYRGPYDSAGVQIMRGLPPGSEYGWARNVIPHAGNDRIPFKLIYALDHMNFLFFEESPGLPMSTPNDLNATPDKRAVLPEYAWWEFDIDDFTGGRADAMRSITDATDPDLSRFLNREGGKLLLYHGWGDSEVQLGPTLDYYDAMVAATFDGDMEAARDKARFFMVPGLGHCGGGPGPGEWDRLAPLVDWVETGAAPDFIVGERRVDGVLENQRRICAYPEASRYIGPAGGENDPANWRADNFECR